ncbi:MAG: hypothetical protein Q9195_005063 [Heterodermia aff. obscurata]
MSSIITYPWTLIGVQVLIFSLLGFTKSSSLLRPSAVVLLLAICLLLETTAHERIDNRAWKCMTTVLAITIPLTAVANFLVDNVTFAAGGPERQAVRNTSSDRVAAGLGEKEKNDMVFRPQSSPFWFAVEQATSRRRIGTPWQIKNVPQFSTRDPSYTPSRSSFLLKTAASLFYCHVLWYFGSTQRLPDYTLVAIEKQPLLSRLREVTVEEIIFRTFCTGFSYLQMVICLKIFPHVFGFIAVASGLSEPAAWPPPFGTLSDLYSVRQFWGVYWHQYLRVTFEGLSNLVARVLHLPKHTLIDRYGRILIAFFVSGTIHIFSDWGMAIHPQESGALRFYVTQAFGIMAEDAFQAAYYHLSGKPRQKHVPMWHKIVGFLWLAVFQVWTSPVWIYPQVRHIRFGADSMYPFLVATEGSR